MSSRNMTLNQIKAADSNFGANHTVKVSGFKDGKGGPKKPRNRIPQWFKEFYDKDYKPFQQAFIESLSKPPKWFSDFVEEQRQFNQYVLDVFKRNNLFQEEVLNQFKKHGWTK